jgi:cytochrome c oxidase assembly protein subunit 11
MVPLYGILCRAAGMQNIAVAEPVTAATHSDPATSAGRRVVVKFDGMVSNGLPWVFRPLEDRIEVEVGETVEVRFVARNLTDEPVSGRAIPSIVPWQATPYLQKIECFCFTQHLLAPGEMTEMTVRFSVSSDLPDGIESLRLSYTFMPADRKPGSGRSS